MLDKFSKITKNSDFNKCSEIALYFYRPVSYHIFGVSHDELFSEYGQIINTTSVVVSET